jgi:hypothetical protein
MNEDRIVLTTLMGLGGQALKKNRSRVDQFGELPGPSLQDAQWLARG